MYVAILKVLLEGHTRVHVDLSPSHLQFSLILDEYHPGHIENPHKPPRPKHRKQRPRVCREEDFEHEAR